MSATVVEQFTRQAASFARLPSHEAATELLLDAAAIGAGDAVLDVACGPGLVACAAARRARHVTGIDLTPAMIEQASALQARLGLRNVAWSHGDAGALPFESASFDAVVTRYSLHHFPDPEIVVAEMLRVARPGGRIALADMVLPSGQAAAYDRMERLRDPSHVRTLSRDELLAVARASGLRECNTTQYTFEIDVERLMRASFPAPGDAGRVRAMLEGDVGVDHMGLGLRNAGGQVRLSYPVCIVSGFQR